jgi:hypothetical protein
LSAQNPEKGCVGQRGLPTHATTWAAGIDSFRLANPKWRARRTRHKDAKPRTSAY